MFLFFGVRIRSPTALHDACYYGFPTLVDFFLEKCECRLVCVYERLKSC